jgi:hypothetical protein
MLMTLVYLLIEWGVVVLVLFCIAGVLALREKPTLSSLIKKRLGGGV